MDLGIISECEVHAFNKLKQYHQFDQHTIKTNIHSNTQNKSQNATANHKNMTVEGRVCARTRPYRPATATPLWWHPSLSPTHLTTPAKIFTPRAHTHTLTQPH